MKRPDLIGGWGYLLSRLILHLWWPLRFQTGRDWLIEVLYCLGWLIAGLVIALNNKQTKPGSNGPTLGNSNQVAGPQGLSAFEQGREEPGPAKPSKPSQ